MSVDKKTYWAAQLSSSTSELEQLLTSLTDDQLDTPVISEEQSWSALDIMAHLLENERAMSIHVHKIRQGRETVTEDFDLNRWNAGLKERAGEPSLPELLQELSQIRAKTLEVMASLSDEEWSLQGRHPNRGMITIEQYYETMVGHVRWHLKDIKSGLGLD